MVRTCICCKYRVNKLESDISLYGFPKNNELRNKWLRAIDIQKTICQSARICSRHFKEDDFRYSLVGGNRFLKLGAIPSLCLNKETNDNRSLFDSENANTEENQLSGHVDECTIENSENQLLDVAESEAEKVINSNGTLHINDECVHEIIERTSTEDMYKNSQFLCHHSNPQVPETISSSSPCQSEPEKKRKRCLYDVRWEEISTSPAQARIYWEVAIGKITRQKVVIKTLRQRVKRLKGKILELRALVKNITNSDCQ